MRPAPEALASSTRLWAAGLVLITAGVVGIGCTRSESTMLPTEPVRRNPGESQSADTPLPRIPIALISRRTPRPRWSPTPAPLTATLSPTPSAATAIPTATAPLISSTPGPQPSQTPTHTPTPTPSGPTVIRLRGISWQWDFYGPDVIGGSRISLRIGQTYELHIYNDAPAEASSHTFSGIPALGIPGRQVFPGDPEYVFPPFKPSTTGNFPFLCTDSSCGVGHDNMTGTVEVLP